MIGTMRVVFDARSVVPNKSGVGNYAESLLRHLVPIAGDMRFLVLRNPSAREPLVRDERVTERSFPGETKSVRTVLELGLRYHFEDYDLYHSPADLLPVGISCPSVVTMHDLMWIEEPKLASAFWPVRLTNGLWYRLTFSQSVARAAGVIAISQATADAIARTYSGEIARKVAVIHHGVDTDRYHPDRAGPRSMISHLIPPRCRYSLMVGQGSPYKNHYGMIRAFVEATRDRPDHRLILVRRFSRVDRPMSRLLRSSEVRRKVTVVPFVSDELLLALYRHARMLLFASHYEGFGMPALEAMSLGTVVLGSTTPAISEITGPAALLAAPGDHSDMVRKIRQLDDDEALRQTLIRTGRERVRSFTWARCAEQTLEVYRQVAAGRSSSCFGVDKSAPRS